MSFSEDARELLRSFVGYRSNNYGYSPRPIKAEDSIEHEVRGLGNIHVLKDVERALRLRPAPKRSDEDIVLALDRVFEEINRRFGPNAMTLWLATRKGVGRYLSNRERPSEYIIPRSAIIISDLGPEGQLFLASKAAWESVGW